MVAKVEQLIDRLKDPIKEIGTIREGLSPNLIERFLNDECFSIKDILARLQIPSSTYFAKKKKKLLLDSSASEKFLRLISVVQTAAVILGKAEAKNWLYRKIPSLGNEVPLDLLDTETGHRLVTQALLQIKYGVYS